MPKKTKVLTDKYKSTTKIYPKVIMDSLTPEVREYIESQGGDTENYFLITAVIPTLNSQLMQYEIDASYVIDLKTHQPVDLTTYNIDNNKYLIYVVSPSPTGEMIFEGIFFWRNTNETTTPATLQGQYAKTLEPEYPQYYRHILYITPTGSSKTYIVDVLDNSPTEYNNTTFNIHLVEKYSSINYLPIISSTDMSGVGMYRNKNETYLYVKTVNGSSSFSSYSLVDNVVPVTRVA